MGEVGFFERFFALYVKPNITYKTAKKIKILDWRLVRPQTWPPMMGSAACGMLGWQARPIWEGYSRNCVTGLTYYFLVAGVVLYTFWAVLQAAEYLESEAWMLSLLVGP
eukprot:6230406-Pyramimonas_sp.AAC.2